MLLESQDTFKPQEIYDVVIVGAGPIGLATAIGLYHRGIENILVIDQTRAFRQVGQILDLLPNGLKALKCLNVNTYTAVRQFSPPSNQNNPVKTSPVWSYKNLQGQLIRSIPLSFDDWFQEYGEGRVSIAWYELQNTLRNLLPPERVKANHRCINVIDEPENNCVRIDCVSDTSVAANPYAHWVENQNSDDNSPQNVDTIAPLLATTSFRAKLIIGADGINSTVRQIIYQNSPNSDFAKPEYSGFAAIFCRDINIPEEIQTEIQARFLQDSAIVTISNDQIFANSDFQHRLRMMLFCRNGQFAYLLHLPLPLDSIQGKTGTDLLNLAQQEIEKADFPDCLKQVVNFSPAANIQQRPYYVHHVINQSPANTIQPNWYQQRVVLIGDAAHGMPPFMAQGANQGLEDALVITNLVAKIAKNNDWDNLPVITEAFANYEHLRRPFMAYIQSATLTGFPQSSDQQWQDYNQKVYTRNFADF